MYTSIPRTYSTFGRALGKHKNVVKIFYFKGKAWFTFYKI